MLGVKEGCACGLWRAAIAASTLATYAVSSGCPVSRAIAFALATAVTRYFFCSPPSSNGRSACSLTFGRIFIYHGGNILFHHAVQRAARQADLIAARLPHAHAARGDHADDRDRQLGDRKGSEQHFLPTHE